ncbi:hypothetical protein EUX98_g7547 [Antrodiella citrinella]|uniref:Uncharacterized protein n=1 Tax=Antrodiella citrinella TaxID=2447956 RepID=A0A4S4MMZ2_9APHY|nr:hypothetical protein EUX98_g7547 [Antrodiella citrinella]
MPETIPTTQEAVWIESLKGAWVVRPNTVPTPEAGEVLVRLEAARLNLVDWKINDYDFGG